MEKIRKICGISEDSQIAGWGCVDGKQHWTFHGADGKFVTVCETQLENVQDFTLNVPHRYRVIKASELAYWRKEYDLADALREVCPCPIENCGYYELTSAMQHVVLEYEKRYGQPNGLHAGDLVSTEEARIVYHEWY